MTDLTDDGLTMTGELTMERKTWSDKELHLVPIDHEHTFVMPKMYELDVDKSKISMMLSQSSECCGFK